MNANIESTSALRRKVTIEVEPDEIRRELDRAYNELRRNVQMRGFRTGRAPRNLLERFFGDQVRGEVIQKLIRDSTDKALEEHELKPLLTPEIVTEETDLTKALRFSAIFDVRPEIVIKDYADLKVPAQTIEVTDEQVASALDNLRERHATLKKVDDRTAVAESDFVLAEIEGFADGKPVEEAKLGQRLLEVSPARLAHGLDAVLTGAQVGVPASATRSYPDDYAEKDLAGKTVEWRALVKEIYRKEVPALDDDFARDLGETQTLEELRGAVRKGLGEAARREADARARQGLLDLIIERNPLEVPQSLVEREQHGIESEMRSAMQAGGMAAEAAAERVREAADEIRTRSEKRAQSMLIVDALADQEGISVSDDELADRVAALVTQSGRERDRVAEHYGHEENRAALMQAMRREKTLEHLLARAQSEAAPSGEPAEE